VDWVDRQHTALQRRVPPQPLELNAQGFHEAAPAGEARQFVGGGFTVSMTPLPSITQTWALRPSSTDRVNRCEA